MDIEMIFKKYENCATTFLETLSVFGVTVIIFYALDTAGIALNNVVKLFITLPLFIALLVFGCLTEKGGKYLYSGVEYKKSIFESVCNIILIIIFSTGGFLLTLVYTLKH